MQLLITKTQGLKNISGQYYATTNIINGGNQSQNLFSIENPVGSSKNIYVKRMSIRGMPIGAATSPFLYRIQRTTGIPSGTILTAQKQSSSHPSPTGIARTEPTATAATGNIWVGSPGVALTSVGQACASPTEEGISNTNVVDDFIKLQPGEALLAAADGNATGWRHFVICVWIESTD